MNKTEREFQVFIKPAGASCNLRCSYCYYLEKAGLYKGEGIAVMPDHILEKYIHDHLEATTDSNVFFSWHGGEPMLAGIDFYKRAISFQQKHNSERKHIMNGMQTNATLVDDEWCRFLAANNFYMGVSIDGPEDIHNSYRKAGNGTGSFSETIRGYMLLKKYNVQTEILTVVSSTNAILPAEVYGFLKSLGSPFLTFLPLVERVAKDSGKVSIASVKPMDFGNFLCAVFDEWVTEDIGSIKIQVIEEALRTAFMQDHTLCIFKRNCGGVPVVEKNGDFYSCDHFVDVEHLVGNIVDTSLALMLDSPKQEAFGAAKSGMLPGYCLKCEVLDMCNGECPKNRFIKTPEGDPGLNYLCSGYRYFFNHIKPFVDAVSDEYKKSR